MRLGTRASKLALAQARLVAALIGDCEIVALTSAGDRGASVQDKSRWVDGLERELAAGGIDLAVHSAKDVPGRLAEGLALLGCPPRAGSADVLIGARSLAELPAGARVGTSSLRRMAQLRAAHGGLEVVALHGNVDTRLAKLAAGQDGLRAAVLAQAGLQRLALHPQPATVLDQERFVPAPGQGTLALEGRVGDAVAASAVASINDAASFAALRAERALAAELQAGCNTPLGAHASAEGERGLRLRVWLGLPDGSHWISDEQAGDRERPEELAARVAGRLLAVGAGDLLARAEELAAR